MTRGAGAWAADQPKTATWFADARSSATGYYLPVE